ncbi:MAG TPA: DUF192 domain-containing protein [Candidatus Paceibacterota bacterium]
MQTRFLFFLIAGIIFLGALFIFTNLKADNDIFPKILKVKTGDIYITVLETKADREKGLSGVKSLPENEAVLFVFDEAEKYGIWMKDMHFPIDIIWLDEAYRIVHVEENISPETFPRVFIPPQKSMYIIEANSSFVDKNEIKVGNVLNFVP